MSKVKGESRQLFEWVKAENSPDEYDIYTTMIEQRGGGKVSQKPAFSQWNGQWLTEEGWKVVEWLKPIPQSSLKEETKIIVWKDGTYKVTEGQTWEYENDENWLVTIQSSLTPKSIRDSEATLLEEIRQIKAVIIHFATLDKMPTLELLDREHLIAYIVTIAQKILRDYPPKKQL